MTQQKPITEEDYGQELTSQFMISEEGNIQIGPDVVARIVEIATLEVEGVILESKFALSDILGGRGRDREVIKGIHVESNEDDNSVNITTSVRMAYGRDMYDLAVKLRKHIKATVEKMTRVIVRRVDIRIVGIITEKSKAEKAEKAEKEKLERVEKHEGAEEAADERE